MTSKIITMLLASRKHELGVHPSVSLGEEESFLDFLHSRKASEKGGVRRMIRSMRASGGLVMGDHIAVDIAQEAHVNVLRSVGAMDPSEAMEYSKSMPPAPSGFWEGVIIDDHLGVHFWIDGEGDEPHSSRKLGIVLFSTLLPELWQLRTW